MITKRRLVLTFDALVYKVIHELHISPKHMAFEDYAQELRIHLFTLADRFDGDIFGDDRFKFTKYAHQGLYWFLIDLLRYDQRRNHQPLPDDYKLGSIPVSQTRDFMLAFWQTAQKSLSEEEYWLCRLLYTQECSMQDLANYFGISRKTLYQRKRKLQNKVAVILADVSPHAMNVTVEKHQRHLENQSCQNSLPFPPSLNVDQSRESGQGGVIRPDTTNFHQELLQSEGGREKLEPFMQEAEVRQATKSTTALVSSGHTVS